MMIGKTLLGIPETLLPEETEVLERLQAGDEPVDVAAKYPASSLAWALLSNAAHDEGRAVESYAYARGGSHRGLDALRRAGWTGQGPVP